MTQLGRLYITHTYLPFKRNVVTLNEVVAVQVIEIRNSSLFITTDSCHFDAP